MSTLRVGIIGTGSRGITCIGRQIAEQSKELDITITAFCNRTESRMEIARDELNELAVASGNPPLSIRFHATAQQLINDPEVDLIVITSPTAAHAEATIPALRSGKKVYLDKPIAHTLEDSIAIRNAEVEAGNPMIMGFTRRYETPWLKLREIVSSGKIGDLKMMLIRAVLPYSFYFQTWHRTRAVSGGALNDKGSHYTDVFNWFVGDAKATQVNAFGGRNVFIEEEDTPEFCSVCDRDCPYRASEAMPDTQDQMKGAVDHSYETETDPLKRKDNCVYKSGADIFDHASIHYQYNNGVVANIFYNVYGPQADDEETLELVGTKGRIILTRLRGEIDIVTDYGEKSHEVIECKSEDFETSHFGADRKLVQEIAAFGRGEQSTVDGAYGLEATRMILAAMKSIDEGGVTVDLENF
ncbi:Gfo/Idh/MocA family oxidoreductase [Verrucomicrobiales bacterium]|jgi:predicted dehydrogenase|nr:Gfo/Idh/MocA family oxidoreductase [Verrucomicrobiales bacterium]